MKNRLLLTITRMGLEENRGIFNSYVRDLDNDGNNELLIVKSDASKARARVLKLLNANI